MLKEEKVYTPRDKKLYTPRDKKLRAKVIWLCYDMPVGEHRKQQSW